MNKLLQYLVMCLLTISCQEQLESEKSEYIGYGKVSINLEENFNSNFVIHGEKDYSILTWDVDNRTVKVRSKNNELLLNIHDDVIIKSYPEKVKMLKTQGDDRFYLALPIHTSILNNSNNVLFISEVKKSGEFVKLHRISGFNSADVLKIQYVKKQLVVFTSDIGTNAIQIYFIDPESMEIIYHKKVINREIVATQSEYDQYEFIHLNDDYTLDLVYHAGFMGSRILDIARRFEIENVHEPNHYIEELNPINSYFQLMTDYRLADDRQILKLKNNKLLFSLKAFYVFSMPKYSNLLLLSDLKNLSGLSRVSLFQARERIQYYPFENSDSCITLKDNNIIEVTKSGKIFEFDTSFNVIKSRIVTEIASLNRKQIESISCDYSASRGELNLTYQVEGVSGEKAMYLLSINSFSVN